MRAMNFWVTRTSEYRARQRFPLCPKDEVVQFSDGKGGDNLKVRTDAKRHLPLNREIGVSA